jgi:plasmid stabilization system protein ParE
MMPYRVRFIRGARDDLLRLTAYWRDKDIATARRARAAIEKALVMLRDFPFSCRKADDDQAFLRELLIPFGAAGYVALFEIDEANTVTVLAIRHQLEDDYH